VHVPIQPGQEFYLIEISHIHKGWERRRFDDRPGKTNMSHEEKLSGWLDTTNDVALEARGHWRIDSVTGDTFIATRLDQ
jgi:hypothetical protein